MSTPEEKLIARLAAAHDPALKDIEGMVVQIWEDGELTLQKGGRLFGCRTIHTDQLATTYSLSPSDMPAQNRDGTHGYAFVSYVVARAFHDEFKSLASQRRATESR